MEKQIRFIKETLVRDPRIGGSIYGQYCKLSSAIIESDEVKGKLLEIIVEVTKKLETVKYHRDNCLREIQKELDKDHGPWPHHPDVIEGDRSTAVEKEFEAFILQGKSCLDVLVKIFEPLFGIKPNTFGAGGKDVIKVLRRNVPKNQAERAKILIDMVEEDKEWIEKWFQTERDSIGHYHALYSTGFRKILRDGRTIVFEPATLDGFPLGDLVESLYENLITFCEDFIPLAMSIKFFPGIRLALLSEDQKDPDMPVKYGFAFEPGVLKENPQS